jgi:hypothetical protein
MVLFVSMSRPIPSIHVFHGNVGGTGKTLFAALLADYFKQEGRDLRCFDTDRSWANLSHYESLDVERLWRNDVNGGVIDFDPVFDSRAEITILDCGPVGYGAFMQYIKVNRLQKRANWMLHVPLMRSRLESSAFGVERMKAIRPLPFVFWLNGFMDGPFTLDEALRGVPISGEELVGSVDLAGAEFELPAKAFNAGMRGMTLTERIEAQTGMAKFRLRQTQKSFARVFDELFETEQIGIHRQHQIT